MEATAYVRHVLACIHAGNTQHHPLLPPDVNAYIEAKSWQITTLLLCMMVSVDVEQYCRNCYYFAVSYVRLISLSTL